MNFNISSFLTFYNHLKYDPLLFFLVQYTACDNKEYHFTYIVLQKGFAQGKITCYVNITCIAYTICIVWKIAQKYEENKKKSIAFALLVLHFVSIWLCENVCVCEFVNNSISLHFLKPLLLSLVSQRLCILDAAEIIAFKWLWIDIYMNKL